jgi:hypothetical protein
MFGNRYWPDAAISSIEVLNGVVRLRKTNYRQQKKTREDARKVRKTEKLGRRETSTTKVIEAGETQSPDSKPEGTN